MKSECNRNLSEVTEFILLGFGIPQSYRSSCFQDSCWYVVTLVGNISMIVVIKMDSRLQMPMYFFLRNLSYLDLCYSTVIAPKTLANVLSNEKKIPYRGCAVQFSSFALSVPTDGVLLAVMASGRFSAICSPLLYPGNVSPELCVQLVTDSQACGCINAAVQTGFTFSLRFRGENRLEHFFCDVPALIKISFVDTFVNEVILCIFSALIIITTTTVFPVSYAWILSSVLKIPSTHGRSRTFSNCGSHVAVVSLFQGTVFFMYAQAGAVSSPEENKVVALLSTLVIPM